MEEVKYLGFDYEIKEGEESEIGSVGNEKLAIVVVGDGVFIQVFDDTKEKGDSHSIGILIPRENLDAFINNIKKVRKMVHTFEHQLF